MRRSKSDPAKYARNYRKISQRRMTQSDQLDEDREMEKLRSILRESEAHLKLADEAADDQPMRRGKAKRKDRNGHDDSQRVENEHYGAPNPSIELVGEETAELILLPNKKKPKIKSPVVQLTPEEIREAKILHKKTSRKLQQLEARVAQKKQRAELYKKLEQHQISSSTLELLSRSGRISRKDTDTKRQALQKLVKKERAGMELSSEEQLLLYPTSKTDRMDKASDLSCTNSQTEVSMVIDANKQLKVEGNGRGEEKEINVSNRPGPGQNSGNLELDDDSSLDSKPPDNDETALKNADNTKKEETSIGLNFAAQMMASLSKLKEETVRKGHEEEGMAVDHNVPLANTTPKKKYVPPEPTQLKLVATKGNDSTQATASQRVVAIKRPPSVEKGRYDLPVSAMEFEIMDAIRNNDVTIVCGETGSGKSTQVPQYLYEYGMCMNQGNHERTFLVGITQPRRVAAVSTAKRVCYEMGCGDGQTIKGSGKKGNIVSYRTRYESAGIGSGTCIQFMTDGILLQEIQNDLLLRRYSVIVLDESHERNLNTDVLIGLLSVALPLRKQAAKEDPSLIPLKLILMSATLRVEDFTENEKLFPMGPPAVVRVPGRTFPVTIHHNKVTELDNYESAVFNKVCKIHRKLPRGGILVFLTGKGEIIRMVNKLRRALNPQTSNQQRFTGIDDVVHNTNVIEDSGLRDMDDDELDGESVPDDELSWTDEANVESTSANDQIDADDNIPKKAYILPLYSLLSTEEQAKVFAPVPDDHRLIVLATNIAETSITIPGISYVVDTGRQKCRNYNAGTGVASYDIMWISKAAADQRAGRAGRTGPGHCYRLYSSSMYSRHMDAFALPEVLIRPLEDVVLAMKAMKVSNVSTFPLPTPPDRSQLDAAVKLLANIGCVDLSKVERDGGDGSVTKLGQAVARLPLGVRYSKMLLVAAQAGVLDYAIVVVSALSENSPFQSISTGSTFDGDDNRSSASDDDSLDDIDEKKLASIREQEKKNQTRWTHRHGDIFATMLAVGAYTYACRDAGGASEQLASRKFCEENGLNHVIMARIQKMRRHLASLAKNRLSAAAGIAAKTGGFSSKMIPPNQLQERLLVQAIASALLDNVAYLAPPGSITGDHPFGVRSAYLSCSKMLKEPLYLDRNSTVFSRDFRQLPQWICYDSIVRKTIRDGSSVTVMKNITPIDPSWLGELAKGTRLLSLGSPLVSPPPTYDAEKDAVLCAVSTKFGCHGWEIPPVKQVMFDCVQSPECKQNPDFLLDDSFRWFARFLLEGKVLPELKGLGDYLNDNPTIITRKTPVAKVSAFVSALSSAGVDSASALKKHWAEKDDKFLFKCFKGWIKRESLSDAKNLWIQAVKQNLDSWNVRKAQFSNS